MSSGELTGDLARERALVDAARRGEDEAWRALFDEYYPRLPGFMRARLRDDALAEDLTAEVFLDAFRGLPRFQWRGKPFGAWLFKVARNRLRMHFRSESRRPDASAEVPAAMPAHTPEPGLAPEIEETLGGLSDDYREAIELGYVLGDSPDRRPRRPWDGPMGASACCCTAPYRRSSVISLEIYRDIRASSAL